MLVPIEERLIFATGHLKPVVLAEGATISVGIPPYRPSVGAIILDGVMRGGFHSSLTVDLGPNSGSAFPLVFTPPPFSGESIFSSDHHQPSIQVCYQLFLN